MRVNKRGVSPIIATVLLIAIVVILAVIIFLWARGFVGERAEKFGRAVELSCADVNFDSDIFFNGATYELDIVNRGNVPIYGLVVKSIDKGVVEIKKEHFGSTIDIGESDFIDLGADLSVGQQLLVVPIILGEVGSGKSSHICQDETGYIVEV